MKYWIQVQAPGKEFADEFVTNSEEKARIQASSIRKEVKIVWKEAAGFESRRLICYTIVSGYKLKVSKHERIAGRWKESKRYHAYLDNDWIGYASTLDGAKLICILTVTQGDD